MLASMENRVRRWLYGRDLAVWYAPEYRWPLSALEARTGFQARRADFALWFLLERRALRRSNLRLPRRAGYDELARVHTPELLDSLGRAETLAQIFGIDPSDVPVDEMMNTVRLVCGAVIDAAREMVFQPNPRRVGRRALNLLGGFHHAAPDVAGGFCPVNDVAVAIAAVRADGFRGRVLVLDLDAHPPDGIAACLARDPAAFLGSISGSDWGRVEGADETVLPERTGDAAYLSALEALLQRLPEAELAFVLAGGDVLAGDPIGRLGLSLDGCRERDLRVADALYRYGILGALRRMGYGPFRVEVHDEGVGQSARLIDVPSGQALIEAVFERREIAGARMLYVHWIALRNPRARFSAERPQLPGQEVPGLGLSREVLELISRMAARLGLEGLAFRPAAYHLAFRGREFLRFVDPARQGRFEALVDLLKEVSLAEATRAVAEGRIRLNGEPYVWETDEMVKWLEPRPDDRAAIDAAKAGCRFTLARG